MAALTDPAAFVSLESDFMAGQSAAYSSPRVHLLTHDSLQTGTAKDEDIGNPAPSIVIPRFGFFPVRIAVTSGARTLSVDVLQPTASAVRPFARIRRNEAIGMTAAVEATAGASTGWQTITANFDASENGGVWIELWNADPGEPCWWDNLLIQ
jgi:hypothetical protein